jgi:hypothetical protein
MSKRLWRDSQGQVWIVSHAAVVSAHSGLSLLADEEVELQMELPMKFKLRVSGGERRLPDLIPDDELETIVQERYYALQRA